MTSWQSLLFMGLPFFYSDTQSIAIFCIFCTKIIQKALKTCTFLKISLSLRETCNHHISYILQPFLPYMERIFFDSLDLNILNALSANARTPYLEIARDNGVSGAAVHQRVQRLMANKVINGAHCCIEPSAVGFTVVAYLGINALPGTDVEALAEELGKIEEITECHVVSGRFDIIAKLYARDNLNMLEIIRERTRQLDIASTETMVSFREAFSRPIPVSND